MKLVLLFQTLNRAELRQLRQYVASPLYNEQPAMMKLFEYMVQNCTSKRGGNFNRAAALTIVFETAATKNDLDLRRLCSDFQRIIEQMLCQRADQSDPSSRQLRLLQAFRERRLNKHFEHQWQQAEAILPQVSYLEQYNIRFERYEQDRGLPHTSPLELQNLSDLLEQAFLLEKLRLACVLLAHQAFYRAEYDPGMLAQLLEQAAIRGYLDKPDIALWHDAYQTIINPTETKHFESLSKALMSGVLQLSPNEKRNLYLLAINFCIRQMNTGAEKYTRSVFELYRNGIESGALIEHGALSRFTFKNTISAGLKLSEHDWVDNFITTASPLIEPMYRNGITQFCRARLHYARGEHAAAMQLLLTAEHHDLLTDLDARVALLKIYFELKEWQPLRALIDTTRNLLYRRNKLSDYHRESYLNFLRMVLQIISLLPNDRVAWTALRGEIAIQDKLPERLWLLERLDVN